MNRDIPIQFTPEYEAMLKRAEDKLRGNISSVKMTEAETAKEIAEIQGGAKSSFEGDKALEKVGKFAEITADIMTTPYEELPLVKHLEQQKKKRGRPVGSKNKPKQGTP